MRRSALGLALGIVAVGVACSTPSTSPTPSSNESAATAAPQSDRRALASSVDSYATREIDTGRVDGAMVLRSVQLVYTLSPSQIADRDALLAAQQDPTSPSYHKWLTPDEYGARFGRSASELAAATAWLEQQGLTVERTSRGALRIFFTGTVAQIESAFQTELHHYLVHGETHFAMAKTPTVPRALGEHVHSLHGLTDFRPKPPHHDIKPVPQFTDGATHYLAPVDFATIYDVLPLFNETPALDGTGMSIAIVGQTSFPQTDIESFRGTLVPNANTQFNVNPICEPSSGDCTEYSANDLPEAELDMEWSGSIAQNATIDFVYTGQGTSLDVFDALAYAIDTNVAPILSASYGACEPELVEFDDAALGELEEVANQASLQGMTLIAATGDDGAGACDHDVAVAVSGIAVQVPSSFPQFTGVGGTEFNEGIDPSLYWSATNVETNPFGTNLSALSYIPEMTWDDLPTGSEPLIGASTGGASILFPKPFWQAGTGVPADNARDVPDISLTASGAHDGYLVYLTLIGQAADGGNVVGFNAIGGTSASAPSFAGILALVEQRLRNAGEIDAGAGVVSGLGNINPTLYSMATSAPTVFHDITEGTSCIPCQAGSTDCPSTVTAPCTVADEYGFAAGTGYDQVTGLGTLDAKNLVAAFLSLAPTATTIAAVPTTAVSGANVALTATVKSLVSTPDMHGTVTFYDGHAELTPSEAVTSGTSGGTQQGTATLNVTTLVLGVHDIYAVYSGDPSYLGSYTTTPVIVTITAPIPDAGTDSGGAADAGGPKDSGAPTDAGNSSDAGGEKDSGAPVDAGAPRDASAPVDAGESHDASAPADAGAPVDSGAPHDAGAPRDASAPIDAGEPHDASAPADAGAPVDSGAPHDAGAPRDASAPIDAGEPHDASAPADAGAPVDSGAPHDAGAPVDSGTTHDASAPTDASAPVDSGTTHDASAPTDAGGGGLADSGTSTDAASNVDSGGGMGTLDSGSADSGALSDDSGTSTGDSGMTNTEDSGATTEDSGSATGEDAAIAEDGSAPVADSGGPTTSGGSDAAADGSLLNTGTGESSGCGCVVAGGDTNDSGAGALGGVLFGLVAIVRRRRSRGRNA